MNYRLALEEFTSSNVRNKWLYFNNADCYLRVYVRKGRRVCADLFYNTLEIATVDATPLGTGTFTKFLEDAETVAEEHSLIVYVENLSTKRFARFFIRRGYQSTRTTPPGILVDQCMFRPSTTIEPISRHHPILYASRT
jgi:hypothetical protein